MKKVKIKNNIIYATDKDSYDFLNSYKEENCLSPISVGFQVTRRCNLKCLHCAEDSLMKDPPLSLISEMLDKLKNGGVKRINITGGEPLVRKDLEEILKLAKNKDFIVSLSTNGLLLTEKKIKAIKPFIENVKISLHGLKKNHETVVQLSGHYDLVIKRIKLLKKHHIPVIVIMSVMNLNKDDIIPVAKLCEELGVDKFFLFTLIPRGRGKIIYDKENFSYSRLKNIVDQLEKTKREENWNLDICIKDWSISGQCILLFPNGDLVATPCLSEKNNTYLIGNILKDDLLKIWQKYPYKNNHIDYYRNH